MRPVRDTGASPPHARTYISTTVEILSPRWKYYHRDGNIITAVEILFHFIHNFSLDSLRCEMQACVQVEIAIMTLDFNVKFIDNFEMQEYSACPLMGHRM